MTFAKKFEGNDSNNNFQIQPIQHTASNFRIPKTLNDVVSAIHQKSKDISHLRENDSTLNIVSFEPFSIANPKGSDSLRKVISKKIESVFNLNSTKTTTKSVEEKRQVPTTKISQRQMKVPPSKEISVNANKEVAGKDESLTQKPTPSDIRDSSSNQSSSIDGEIEKQYEESKTELGDNKDKPFKCEDCGKSFSQLRNYKYHR